MRTWALCGTTVCAAAIAIPATAIAAEKAIWGPTTLPTGTSAFPTYENLGVDTLQFSLDWSQVAPTRPADPRNPRDPAYRWPADIDQAAREAPGHGIRLALLAIFTPPWANGGRAHEWVPTNRSDYADFLTAASRRYSGVRRWMIWSEPNKAQNFQPNATGSPMAARAYAPLLEAAYGALKSVSRNNVVIGGMTWSAGDVRPAQFLRQMRLPNGRRPRLDWFGHNPFPFRFPRLSKKPLPGGFRDMSDLDTYSAEVRKAYGRTVPFWLSEFTIQSDQASRTFAGFVSRQNQAKWLTAAYRIADREVPVAGLGWLDLIDQPPGPGNEFFGLLTSTLQRKPSYAAYAQAPSQRFRPKVTAPRSARASSLARGLRVRVRPKTAGRITVELRRGGRRVARVSASGGTRTRTVRLRARARRGTYQLQVLSSRGSTVTSTLRVR